MATKTFRLRDTAAGSGYSMDEGSADADAYFHGAGSASGWSSGSGVGNGNYSNLDYNTEAGGGTFSPTEPTALVTTSGAGNYFRSETTLNGIFAAGSWNFTQLLRAHTAAWSGRGRLRFRVFRATSPDGVGATEITSSAIQAGATTANISTTANTTQTASWSNPEFTLANEHLFIMAYWNVTSANSNVGGDINLRRGGSIVTSDFTPWPIEHVGMVHI